MEGFQKVKNFLLKNKKINLVVSAAFRLISRNRKRIRGKNNRLVYDNTYAKRCRIDIIGSNNHVVFKGTNYLEDCCFHIRGNNNEIVLDDLVCAYHAVFCIEDDGGRIEVGYKSLLSGKIEIASTEGTAIKIGKNCLFSSNIDIRSGDSHSIYDESGKRINKASDICVGDHVWIGRSAVLLKGTRIPNGCVVGAGAILNKAYEKDHAILVGVPARIVKENIEWKHERE